MTDVIRIDVPAFLRLLELAKEDVDNDMDLHDVTQRVTELSKDHVISMKDYDQIVDFMKSQGDDSPTKDNYSKEIENIRRLGGMRNGS